MLIECGVIFFCLIWKGWFFLYVCFREKEWQIVCLEFDERNKCNQKYEYIDILNEKLFVFVKIVLNIYNLIGRYGFQKFILLCFVKIFEIEIINGLIEVFCLLFDLKNEIKLLNLVDDEGNFVLYILL